MPFLSLKKKQQTRAFTLLEILLVVAIIAILAGIVIVAINPAKQLGSARDSQRKSDISNLYKAVNQYLIDKGTPPLSITDELQPICVLGQSSNCVDLSVLVPDYLTTIPVDPQASTYSGYEIAKVGDNVYVEAPLTEIGFTQQPGYASTTAIVAFVGVVPDAYYPGPATNGAVLLDQGGDTPVNGTCGDAATSYAYDASFPSGDYCSTGTADPASPSDPSQGGSTEWTCTGSNGGTTSGTCTATREVDTSSLQSGLITHYTFDAIVNDAFTDTTGRGHTLTSTSPGGVTVEAGKLGNAAHFVGGAYLSSPDADDLDFTTSYSLMAWIKTDTTSGRQAFVSKHDDGCQRSYAIRASSGTAQVQMSTPESPCQYTHEYYDGPLPAGEWNHVVMTYTANTAKVYINGNLINTHNAPYILNVSTSPLTVGADGAGLWRYSGLIDEVALWNRTLSAQDVTDLYNGGNGVSLE